MVDGGRIRQCAGKGSGVPRLDAQVVFDCGDGFERVVYLLAVADDVLDFLDGLVEVPPKLFQLRPGGRGLNCLGERVQHVCCALKGWGWLWASMAMAGAW